ncbi:MAG TPA: hypothetical protein VGE72_08885 [Azospirillum sp.]
MSTVRRIENGSADTRVSSLESVRKVLEAAGVEFSPDGTAVRFIGKADGKG